MNTTYLVVILGLIGIFTILAFMLLVNTPVSKQLEKTNKEKINKKQEKNTTKRNKNCVDILRNNMYKDYYWGNHFTK